LNLWQKKKQTFEEPTPILKTTNTNATLIKSINLIKPKDATDMPAISKEDSFNQLTIAELEKVLLCNNFNLK
jgi:hypothetical protein